MNDFYRPVSKQNNGKVKEEIDYILVPQGAEYETICKGFRSQSLKSAEQETQEKPPIIPIPMGKKPVREFLRGFLAERLAQQDDRPSKILMMGVCGSLSPQYPVGQIVVYRECIDVSQERLVNTYSCDTKLGNFLANNLQQPILFVRGLTSDRLITSSQEKKALHQTYQADVVDMEASALLEAFPGDRAEITILRVVSDDAQHNIADFTSAITPRGKILPLALTRCCLQNPLGAYHLIRGSLKALRILEKVAQQLASA